MPVDLLAFGCSWGGLGAMTELLTCLPDDLAVATVIVQHRSESRSHLAGLLGRVTSVPVIEAEDKARIEPSHVYLAPPGYHLMVEGDRFALATEGPVCHARPSIDVLFSTAAEALGDRLAAVVLTGANADGAEGLARVAALGGWTFVQDPSTAVRRAMPDAAIAAVPDAVVGDLPALARLLTSLIDGCGP